MVLSAESARKVCTFGERRKSARARAPEWLALGNFFRLSRFDSVLPAVLIDNGISHPLSQVIEGTLISPHAALATVRRSSEMHPI